MGETWQASRSGGVSMSQAASSMLQHATTRNAARTAAREAKQRAERVQDATRYAAAAARGQVTVFTREPAAGTAAARAQSVINLIGRIQRGKGATITPYHEKYYKAELTAARTEFARIGAAKATAAAAAAAEADARKCPRGERYDIHFWQSCDAGYTKKLDIAQNYHCQCNLVAPSFTPTPPATPLATPPPADCPEGLFYDATWYQKCKEGYVEYSCKGHNKCVCSAKMAEAKAQLDSLYANGGGNGEGEGFFGGLSDIGKIGDILPIIIGGAIAVALIGLLKK